MVPDVRTANLIA